MGGKTLLRRVSNYKSLKRGLRFWRRAGSDAGKQQESPTSLKNKLDCAKKWTSLVWVYFCQTAIKKNKCSKSGFVLWELDALWENASCFNSDGRAQGGGWAGNKRGSQGIGEKHRSADTQILH